MGLGYNSVAIHGDMDRDDFANAVNFGFANL